MGFKEQGVLTVTTSSIKQTIIEFEPTKSKSRYKPLSLNWFKEAFQLKGEVEIDVFHSVEPSASIID